MSVYGAVYFIKQWSELNVFSRDLNDPERQELQTRHGAVVRSVVNGSPASKADLQIGDVITAVDGIAIDNAHAFEIAYP